MSTAERRRAGPGRPRRFDPEIETRMLFDAALAVMRRNGFEGASVAEILSEAGLSTRSFYRSFDSKDDLLRAMYRRNAQGAAERLAARVARASSPRDGLEAWIDSYLGFTYDAPKAERVAVLGSWGARQVEGYQVVEREAFDLLIAPLVEVLERGLDSGAFPLARPHRDALTINAIVHDMMHAASGARRLPREEALEHCLRFCLPALGA